MKLVSIKHASSCFHTLAFFNFLLALCGGIGVGREGGGGGEGGMERGSEGGREGIIAGQRDCMEFQRATLKHEPDSGFMIPCLRVARISALLAGKQTS